MVSENHEEPKYFNETKESEEAHRSVGTVILDSRWTEPHEKRADNRERSDQGDCTG